MNDMTFSLTAALDRMTFEADRGIFRHLVARIRAHRRADPRPVTPPPLDIALVIDASGSMAGEKLEAAKQAALGLAERLTARDRLTVVSFASDVQIHLDAVPVTAANAARIRSEIMRLETRGLTCLSEGWFAGVECAARAAKADPRMIPRVILLSDGHANEGITDPDELCEHAGELRLRGVLTSALGIGDDYDEQLLRGIAEDGGGRLHDAERAEEISTVLLGELDDIFGTVVEDAEIILAMPPGVKAEVLGRGRLERHGGKLRLSLGPVRNEVERVAVFRLTCPQAKASEALRLRMSARGRAVDDPSWLESDTVDVTLSPTRGNGAGIRGRDEEVARIVARIWHAHVVATAARMNRDGAFDAARQHVERELRHFRRHVAGLEEGAEWVEELERLARHVSHRFSSRLHKEMVLHAALACESRTDYRMADRHSWSALLEEAVDIKGEDFLPSALETASFEEQLRAILDEGEPVTMSADD